MMMYVVVIIGILYFLYKTYMPKPSIMRSYPDLRAILEDFPETSIYNGLMEKNVVAFLEAYAMSFSKGPLRVPLEDMRKYARRFQKYALEIILRLPGDMALQETLEDHVSQVMATLETLLEDIERRHRT
jgi:hypothetical protein